MRKYGLVGKVLAAVIAVAMQMAVCDHTALFLGGLIIAVCLKRDWEIVMLGYRKASNEVSEIFFGV